MWACLSEWYDNNNCEDDKWSSASSSLSEVFDNEKDNDENEKVPGWEEPLHPEHFAHGPYSPRWSPTP